MVLPQSPVSPEFLLPFVALTFDPPDESPGASGWLAADGAETSPQPLPVELPHPLPLPLGSCFELRKEILMVSREGRGRPVLLG